MSVPAGPSGKDCGLCAEVLEEACTRFKGDFCSMRERYLTDPGYTADDVLLDLTLKMTADQRDAVSRALMEKGSLTPLT